MGLLYTDVKTIVQNYCKVGANSELTDIISNAIDTAFYDIVRERPWPDLLVPRVTLTLTTFVSSGYKVVPPVEFLKISRVLFHTTVSPIRTWALAPFDGPVPPAPISGKPRAWREIQTSNSPLTTNAKGITLDPPEGVAVTDQLIYDYYFVPDRPSSGPGFLFPSTLWDNELIYRAEHYVLVFQNKMEQAKEKWAEVLNAMGKAPNTQPNQ